MPKFNFKPVSPQPNLPDILLRELRDTKKNHGEEQEGKRESGFDEEGCVGLP